MSNPNEDPMEVELDENGMPQVTINHVHGGSEEERATRERVAAAEEKRADALDRLATLAESALAPFVQFVPALVGVLNTELVADREQITSEMTNAIEYAFEGDAPVAEAARAAAERIWREQFERS